MGFPKTVTFRLTPELRTELEAAIEARQPYPPTITSVVLRGVALALAEMKAEKS